LKKYRVDFWELGPLGWRGSSELDNEFATATHAIDEAQYLLAQSASDGVIGYAAVVRSVDNSVVWEARNHAAPRLLVVGN